MDGLYAVHMFSAHSSYAGDAGGKVVPLMKPEWRENHNRYQSYMYTTSGVNKLTINGIGMNSGVLESRVLSIDLI